MGVFVFSDFACIFVLCVLFIAFKLVIIALVKALLFYSSRSIQTYRTLDVGVSFV